MSSSRTAGRNADRRRYALAFEGEIRVWRSLLGLALSIVLVRASEDLGGARQGSCADPYCTVALETRGLFVPRPRCYLEFHAFSRVRHMAHRCTYCFRSLRLFQMFVLT
mmetsp:Transcript_132738/g.424697  ORF Transcript_132738/g.424697 Transcript_132738/m.424697 type:complete len:109 (-) Transcript_132738:123-449(-)